MTVIVACARRRLMCSDSQWTDGNERGARKKVYRQNGTLYGLSGDCDRWDLWLEASRADALEAMRSDLSGVVVLRLGLGGLAVWDNTNFWFPIAEGSWAVGSGGAYARGAMAAGATPARACAIAIRLDARSGGAVRTYKLPKG